MKPARPREVARADIAAAVVYYRDEAGEKVALDFVDALEKVLHGIERRPATGSPRYAHELDLPGLRSRPIGKYPYLMFYIERADHIDVWRVLHARRNIPKWLAGSEDAPASD